MWQPDRTKLLKIRLHSQGEDGEWVWVEDRGAALLHPGRYVRLANVPILHLKPTYGDVIEVLAHDDGTLEWDACGVDFREIGSRILEDGGRWVAIIDYWPSRRNSPLQSALDALNTAGAARDIAIEGVFSKGNRGCAYLAVPGSMSLAGLVTWLHSLSARLGYELRHPEVHAP